MKQTGEFVVGTIHIDAAEVRPIYRQIYDGIKRAVLDGRLEPGLRLPSTRDLAERLGVSRNTAKLAFEQLIAEGFLVAAVGSGTRVAANLPGDLLNARTRAQQISHKKSPDRQPEPLLSQRAQQLAQIPTAAPAASGGDYAFRSGMPAIDAFPFEQWGRLATRYYRNMPASWTEASPVDPLGYQPLRRAIATYLKSTRGVQCAPEQVIVTTGTQQGLYLASQALLNAGDVVWLEEPGYPGARHAFALSGATLAPVPVDENGLAVEKGIQLAPAARLVYTTPSHQFPLGGTLSLERRFTLLHWADRSNAWIIEDDYDSEFRYTGYPTPALQGLDTANRVIYSGSFNKVLFPGLRLGYLVVPAPLVSVFAGAMEVVSGAATITNQVVLTTFIEGGHFQRHIRRMRLLYAARVAEFARQAERLLGEQFALGTHEAGMHFALYLPDGVSMEAAVDAAARHDIDVTALSRFAIQPLTRAGLLLGCCAVPEKRIAARLEQLSQALRGIIR